MPDATPSTFHDVAVIGGGLAGKAASLHLKKAGFAVVCFEPPEPVRPPVGESLDWSVPELFRQLGISQDALLRDGIATWKKHVTLKMADGCEAHYVPTEWLGKPPLNINLETLHVDRVRLDQEIQQMVVEAGIDFVRDRVVDLETRGEIIEALRTETGTRYSAKWFIDASGSGSFIGRKFDLASLQYGPAKVAIWTYFKVPQQVEGTTLYMDPKADEYLEWVWEIPVSPELVSVGYIAPGTVIKSRRDEGRSMAEVLRSQLGKFPRFQELMKSHASSEVHVTSFKCRVFTTSAGPNWLLTGEAASMVDPMTSNGVTAALRHGAEAARLIMEARGRDQLSGLNRKTYGARILQMAKFFNQGIERVIYEPVIRNRIGLGTAGAAYTSPAWSMNVVYARLKPWGLISTFILGSMLAFFRLWASAYYRYCLQQEPLVRPKECRLRA